MDNDKDQITDVEIPDEAPAPAADAAAPLLMSDLAEGGLTQGEIEMAKAQGLVAKTPAEEAAAAKAAKEAKDKADAAAAAAAAANGKPVDKKPDGSVEERFRMIAEGKSPEKIITEIAEKGELTKEQEKVLLASLTQNGQAMYWAQKKERQKRQKVEVDSASALAAKQKEIDDLKAQLSRKPAPVQKLDEFGDPIEETPEEKAAREKAEADADAQNPKKKPLTLEDLERIEKEKQDRADEEAKKRADRAAEIRDALNYQQESAKTRYADFDKALEKVTKILNAANTNQLGKLFSDPLQQSRVFQKCKDLILAYARADQFEEGEYNPADMTYDLSQELKDSANDGADDDGDEPNNNASRRSETGADGTPESARRVLSNANRRGSSATLNGGGSRRIPLDELTPEKARRIPTSKWNKLPKADREKLLGKV